MILAKSMVVVLTTILLVPASLTFAQKEKKSTEEIVREQEVERVEKVLKISYSELKRHRTFNIKAIKRGIRQIQNGNQRFLKTITYDNLLLFIRGLILITERSHSGGLAPLGLLTNEAPEKLVINSFFGALKNKDPRIRLFAIDVLITFNVNIKQLKKLIRIAKQETDLLSNYHYVDMDLNVQFGNLRVELFVLQKTLRRRVLVQKMKKYSHPSMLINIKRINFVVLADRIANEPNYEIPLYNYGEREIDYLIAGLLNPDVYVKQRCAEYIYDIYHAVGASTNVKKRIDQLMGDPFSFEKEAKKSGYRTEFLLYRKKYPMLVVEGSTMLKAVFAKLDKERFEAEEESSN